ncbi:hypothetical protein UFOVP461_5 [uncultured Caudovirales phage]|jgi:hypothetical protein|uniref:Uncharacterized protein n=1 Tax=uncultured Caudovirales phage TaxID=2100421 RepID=A0A6J5MG44_9CAUD|nr:hypothetical protein UFOVP461_5 [uncultured Caudovirales phage]CAB4189328.1 hypothetical protein UFOVP1185_35 [uncultured Caudovirales phage]
MSARTIEVTLTDAPYEGWKATMRAEGISARVFIELSSNSVERQMEAVSKLVISHDFRDSDGNPAEDILDAPMDALGALIGKWGIEVAALPPR